MSALLRSDALRRADFLNPIQLVDYTRFVADEVSNGKYPFIDFDSDTRWHQRIYRDQRVDLWLISWLPTQGAQLHDHGGSAGSFTVLSGELSESVYVPSGPRAGTVRERAHAAGRSVGFDAAYIHDVRNTSQLPAVSVHAYSRPLTTMNFWEIDNGRLVKLATLDTDDPEPELTL